VPPDEVGAGGIGVAVSAADVASLCDGGGSLPGDDGLADDVADVLARVAEDGSTGVGPGVSPDATADAGSTADAVGVDVDGLAGAAEDNAPVAGWAVEVGAIVEVDEPTVSAANVAVGMPSTASTAAQQNRKLARTRFPSDDPRRAARQHGVCADREIGAYLLGGPSCEPPRDDTAVRPFW
jgi:hypothetical protein